MNAMKMEYIEVVDDSHSEVSNDEGGSGTDKFVEEATSMEEVLKPSFIPDATTSSEFRPKLRRRGELETLLAEQDASTRNDSSINTRRASRGGSSVSVDRSEENNINESSTPSTFSSRKRPLIHSAANRTDTVDHDLPMLLRRPDNNSVRNSYPHSAHAHWSDFDSHPESCGNPYKGRIVWSRISGHPYWPSRMATSDELESLWKGKVPELSADQTLDEGNPNDRLMMFFFGSQELGVVKRNQTEPFLLRYKEYANKASSKSFLLGLEEADGDAMRNFFVEGVGVCMLCGGTDDPTGIILCDRCNSEAHMRCMDPPIAEVPEGEWLCPICTIEAPYTVEKLKSLRHTSESSEDETPEKMGGKKKGTDTSSSSEAAFRMSMSEIDDIIAMENEETKPYCWRTFEDKRLIELLFETRGNWEKVAKGVGRTMAGCRNRHMSLVKKGKAPLLSLLTGRNGSRLISQEELISYINGFDEDQGSESHKTKRPAAIPNSSPRSRNEPQQQEPTSSSNQQPESKKPKLSAAPNPTLVQQQIKKPRSLATTTSTTNTESQLSQMIREVTSAPRRDISNNSNICYICTQGGADTVCSDENCDKTYHKFCLGAAGPGPDNSFDEGWHCPWHYCAVCPRPSSPQTLGPSYCGSPNLSDIAGSKLMPVPTRSELNHSQHVNGSSSSSSKSQPRYFFPSSVHSHREQSNEQPTPLLRCAGCPLALCQAHADASFIIPLNNAGGGVSHGSVFVQRRASAEPYFFACERCSGVITADYGSKARYLQQMPGVQLARCQDRLMSELVRTHGEVLSFLLQSPSRQTVELSAGRRAVEPFFSLYENTPLSLGDVQCKVRCLAYTSIDQFRKDLTIVSEALSKLYERMHPRLSEAARSLPYYMEDIIRQNHRSIQAVEQRAAEDDKLFTELCESSMVLPIQGITDISFHYVYGLCPWENYHRTYHSKLKYENAVQRINRWNEKVHRDIEASRGEQSTFALLIQSLEAAKLIAANSPNEENALLTPSREELEQLFDNHSSQLRAALRSAAELRRRVGLVLNVVDGLSQENFDYFEPVLTIGGTRPATEQQAANRALQAKLDETLQALEMERKARLALEKKLNVS